MICQHCLCEELDGEEMTRLPVKRRDGIEVYITVCLNCAAALVDITGDLDEFTALSISLEGTYSAIPSSCH